MEALRRGTVASLLALFALGCSAVPRGPEPREGLTLVRCAGPAPQVFAVGDFNGWRDPGAPLRPEPDGSFSAWLSLPPGPGLVACRRKGVSGEIAHEPPLNAERLVEDGFGGRDGLFVVAPRPEGGW